MKKSILIITLFALNHLHAQLPSRPKAFFELQAGYSLDAAPQAIGSSNSGTLRSLVTGSFGNGMTIGANAGIMLTKSFGAELGLSYLHGSSISIPTTNGNTDLQSQFIQAKPSIILMADLLKIKPYAKFGMNIAKGNIKGKSNITSGSNISYQESELSGGLAIGFQSSLGIQLPIGPKLAAFGELNYQLMSYAPSEGKITKATTNGIDNLSSMTTRDINTVFVESYDTSVSSSSTEPRKQLKQYYNMNSVGLNVGMKIIF